MRQTDKRKLTIHTYEHTIKHAHWFALFKDIFSLSAFSVYTYNHAHVFTNLHISLRTSQLSTSSLKHRATNNFSWKPIIAHYISHWRLFAGAGRPALSSDIYELLRHMRFHAHTDGHPWAHA